MEERRDSVSMLFEILILIECIIVVSKYVSIYQLLFKQFCLFNTQNPFNAIRTISIKICQTPMPFQMACVNMAYNLGSFSQLPIVPMYRDQSRLTGTERKDAYRKPLLPHLTGS